MGMEAPKKNFRRPEFWAHKPQKSRYDGPATHPCESSILKKVVPSGLPKFNSIAVRTHCDHRRSKCLWWKQALVGLVPTVMSLRRKPSLIATTLVFVATS